MSESEGTPSDGAPAEATSTEGAPGEATPAEATPAEATPADAGRSWLAVGALAVAIVLLVVAAAALWSKERSQQRQADRLSSDDRVEQLIALAAVQDPEGPAMVAARTATERLLSYDFRTLDQDFAEAAELLTTDYREKFVEFTDKIVVPSAEQAKAVVQAQVQVLAPTEATTVDRVVALVFVDQTTTSALLDAPAIDQSRVTLTLLPVEGRWLVDNLVVTGA